MVGELGMGVEAGKRPKHSPTTLTPTAPISEDPKVIIMNKTIMNLFLILLACFIPGSVSFFAIINTFQRYKGDNLTYQSSLISITASLLLLVGVVIVNKLFYPTGIPSKHLVIAPTKLSYRFWMAILISLSGTHMAVALMTIFFLW